MSRFVNRKGIASLVMVTALIASFMLGAGGVERGIHSTFASSTGEQPLTYSKFVQNIAAHHKAPFLSKELTAKTQVQQFVQKALQRNTTHSIRPNTGWTNTRVNQDRNPWPKAGVGAGIDPHNGQNYTVMSTDSRQLYDHQFYHVSTDGGKHWTDDSLTNSIDPANYDLYSAQDYPGVAYDRNGHSILSSLSSNFIIDPMTKYVNFDTEVDVTQGYANGTFSSVITTPIDYIPCNGTYSDTGIFACPGVLDKPFVTVDNVQNSPSKDTIYAYYTYFCFGTTSGGDPGTPTTMGPCVDGNITIPPNSSVILESHAAGAGLPFSAPRLVSGLRLNAQFSSLVVDSHGKAHIFFEDFTDYPLIRLYQSSLSGNTWVVSPSITNFKYYGLNNINWAFRDTGSVAPACSIYQDTAYCAFSASQIGTNKASGTPQVYLIAINTLSTSVVSHTRVNNDPFNDGKDHFFPWAAATKTGDVYVGWFDNRNDPFNAKVEYFVGKSVDGGHSFPKQQAVSDISFNPCVGYPGCRYFGDYDQLVVGPDSVAHAAWSDTRDGVSMQLYTQAVKW